MMTSGVGRIYFGHIGLAFLDQWRKLATLANGLECRRHFPLQSDATSCLPVRMRKDCRAIAVLNNELISAPPIVIDRHHSRCARNLLRNTCKKFRGTDTYRSQMSADRGQSSFTREVSHRGAHADFVKLLNVYRRLSPEDQNSAPASTSAFASLSHENSRTEGPRPRRTAVGK